MEEERTRAQALTKQGEEYERRGNFPEAENAYLRALSVYESLRKDREDPSCAEKAHDLCLRLADLSMQQGNMHAADRYYVLALSIELSS